MEDESPTLILTNDNDSGNVSGSQNLLENLDTTFLTVCRLYTFLLDNVENGKSLTLGKCFILFYQLGRVEQIFFLFGLIIILISFQNMRRGVEYSSQFSPLGATHERENKISYTRRMYRLTHASK